MLRKIVPIRAIVAVIAALFVLAACAGNGSPSSASSPGEAPGPSSGVTINVYNWGDYIDEEVLPMFTEETGINVVYDVYANNEDMYTKIKNGGSEYDVLFPSDYMIEKMINENMLAELDLNNIPNISNIDKRFRNPAYDPGDKYSVPYMWGTLGILYNTEMVDEEVNSWDILWDEKYAGSIFMYDSLRDSIGVSLIRQGYSLNSTNIDELNAAKASLIEQMPIVRAFLRSFNANAMFSNTVIWG